MRKMVVVLLVLFIMLLTPAIAFASHSEGHFHNEQTAYNEISTEGYYLADPCYFQQNVYLVDRTFYDWYHHKYVIFDLWYNDVYQYSSYYDNNFRLQGSYIYYMC